MFELWVYNLYDQGFYVLLDDLVYLHSHLEGRVSDKGGNIYSIQFTVYHIDSIQWNTVDRTHCTLYHPYQCNTEFKLFSISLERGVYFTVNSLGIESVWKIFWLKDDWLSQSINELINDGGDCRTAPASPGLLIITPCETFTFQVM